MPCSRQGVNRVTRGNGTRERGTYSLPDTHIESEQPYHSRRRDGTQWSERG
jgi:hypothetical protein